MNHGKALLAQLMESVPWTRFASSVTGYSGDAPVSGLPSTEFAGLHCRLLHNSDGEMDDVNVLDILPVWDQRMTLNGHKSTRDDPEYLRRVAIQRSTDWQDLDFSDEQHDADRTGVVGVGF